MKKSATIFLSAVLSCLVSSCVDPNSTSDADLFSQRTGICVVVGRKDMIDFSSGDIQTSFNQSKHLYRAGLPKVQMDSTSGKMVETVEEYYVLSLDAVPSAAGTTMNGSLHLKASTLSAGFRTYSISPEVVKLEGNLAWLWDSSLKVGVVARISE